MSIKIKRIIRTATVLLLLLTTLIATPVYAAKTIALNTTQGKIGDTITVTGTGFSPSTEITQRYINLFFSSNSAGVANLIDTNVTTYAKVREAVPVYEDGAFSTTFTVPSTMNDGTVDAAVTSGTYYIYASREWVDPLSQTLVIGALATFTVVGGEITIDSEEGPVGTPVVIDGIDFPGNADVSFKFDGSTVDIEDGDDSTNSSGDFTSVILVPESTAGDKKITVTVGSSAKEVTFTVEPDVVLNPTSGKVGDTVTVSGTGFSRRKNVTVYFNNIGVATGSTSLRGTFPDTKFNVPPGLSANIYNIDVEDDDQNLDTVKFTVTGSATPEPPPTPTPEPTPTPTPTPPPATTTGTVTPSSGSVGATAIISGTGFKAGAQATIIYGTQEIAKVTVDPNGIVVAAFRIPASHSGDNTITINDGASKKDVTFTMESQPPQVPQPTLPEMGVRAKPPVAFTWQESADESQPVTYQLQIATDSDFRDRDIIIDKKGLEETKYTLTEDEMIELIDENATYYWRLQATDAAQNSSDWTGSGEFSVAVPFKIPDWALYTILGLGGVLLFAFGYLLGRRSGLYY